MSDQGAPKAPPVEERIRVIAGMMARGEWSAPRSHWALAEQWGLAVGTIRCNASEASRMLQTEPEEREQLRTQARLFFARMKEQAANEKSAVTGLADVSAALKAQELEARYGRFEPTGNEAPAGPPPRIEVRLLPPETPSAPEGTPAPENSPPAAA